MLTPGKESYDHPRQNIKKQRHYFANKGPSSQGYGFSRGHVWMWELDYKESWVQKNWCFWTVVLEKTVESPLDCKAIQPVHPKGDGSWVFIGRTDAEAETPILWPPDAKGWLIGKDPDAGKDWGQEEKGTTGGWAGWVAPLTRWTWVWVDSGSWWWTGSPGVLWFMGSQRVGHNWATELKLRKTCLSRSCHHRPANGAGCLFSVWRINNLVHRGSKSSFGVGLSLVGNNQQILKKREQLWEVINRAL